MSKVIKNKIEVFFDEDVGYIVVGTASRIKAGALIRKYEKEDCGMDKDDLFRDECDLEPVKMVRYKDEWDEDYFYWGEEDSCEKCHRPFDKKRINGFIYYI